MNSGTDERAPLGWGHPATWLASWGGAGFLPKAPGTWGSLGAVLVALPIAYLWGTGGLGAALVLVALAGWWCAHLWSTTSGAADPQAIVVDEVVGQWLVLLVTPVDFSHYAGAFILFRIFDIAKPWPVSWADKKVGGAMGIMLDDVIAGTYGLSIMLLWVWMTEG